MNEDPTNRLDESLMDWALGERLGGEQPPDLREAVRQRLAEAHPTATMPSVWPLPAIAAAILLGTLVVFAVAWSRRQSTPDDPAAASPQDPSSPARVSSRTEIEALSADTRHVIGVGIEDDEVPALLRLRHLDTLELLAIVGSPLTPGQTLRPMYTLTDEGLRRLASMKQLRVLRLVNQTEIGAAGLDALAHLPTLEELTVQTCTADDEAFSVLSRIPQLRVLRLNACTKVGERTIARIAAIGTLRDLSLAACGHLQEEWLASLGALQRLEALDLGMIGSRTFFTGLSPVELPEPGSGITDSVLRALRPMHALRRLDLSYAGVTSTGLQELITLPLVDLDLTGVEVRPEDLQRLPTTLRKLTLRGTKVSYPDLGGTLAEATPDLEELRIDSSEGVGDPQIESLATLRHLRRLDISHCRNVSAKGFAALTRLPALEELTMRGSWTFLDDDGTRLVVQAMPKLRQFVTDKGPAKLR